MTPARSTVDRARTRATVYLLVAVGMVLGSVVLPGSTWQGSTQLHTLIEAIATSLALIIGIMALLRFYAQKNSTFLFVGSGFLGTAFLDGYHTVVTSTFFASSFPSVPSSLIPWSWIASRLFLSMLLAASWWAWRREARGDGRSVISERAVYAFVAVVTAASFLLFAFVPLPRAYYPEIIFHRPEELIAAAFFAIALIGYLRKGEWKSDLFEHWLVLSILVGLIGQTAFMSFSGQLFDGMFDVAHLLKTASYILVLTGLLGSMYELFRRAELRRTQDALAESAERYRTLVEVSPEVIAVHCEGTIVFTNQAGARLLGASSPDEIIGRPTLDFVHPDYREPATARVRQAGPDGAPSPLSETQLLRMDGQPIDVEMLAAAITYQGKPAWLLLARDISVRKRAEEALQITQERLAGILEIAADAVISIDDAQTIVFFNKAAEQIFGYRAPEILGQPLDVLVPESLRNVHTQQVVQFAAASESGRGMSERPEVRGLRKDGSEFPAEASISKVEVGGMPMMTVILRDVTERTRALEQLRDSEERLRLVMGALAEGLAIYDANSNLVEMNAECAALYGVSPEEALGQRATTGELGVTFLTAAGRPAKYSELPTVRAFREARPLRNQLLGIRRRDGTEVYVRSNSAPIFRPDADTPHQVLVTYADVTERKQAEESLALEHARTEQLLGAISLVLIGVDLDGHVHLWNRAAEQAFGQPARAVRGRTLRDCPTRWDWSAVEPAIAECLERGAPARLNDVRYATLDGSDGFLTLSVNPVSDDAGERSGYLIVAADVTERRVLEAQLTQAQKLESIGQLAAGIAHEINTPTQYVGDNTRFLQDAFRDLDGLLASYARLAQTVADGEDTGELLQQLASASEEMDLEYLHEEIPLAIEQSLEGVGRVAHIVQAMKEFSHPGADEKTAIDINRQIESTITVARNEWKYVSELVTDFDPGLPLVPCLPGELNQVILNMIINAAHAIAEKVGDGSEGKGTITIATRRGARGAEILISDTGTGIPESIRARIFDPFFTTKGVGRGTGQGLAISRSVIVDKHGGTLTFETEPGEGTTFTISLPLDEPAAAA